MDDASGDESETSQALLIPELLRRIFELSTNKSNVSNACVCKDWCEEALSVIWSDVEAYPLFAVLAPMGVGFGSERSFSRDLEEGDWDRFERYSWRVQSLRFNTKFNESVFNKIAVGRRRLDFLPNLAAVYNPPPSANIFPLFAHASVRTLNIHPDFDGKNMALLPSRMRHLERLICVIRPQSSRSIVVSALQQLESLIHLTISADCLNVDTFHALASLPNLRSINTRNVAVSNTNTSVFGSVTTSSASVTAGVTESVASKVFPLLPFPSLKELDVHLRFSTAIEWIPIANHSKSLRILKIQSSYNESAADYMHLTNRIGLLCAGIESLELARGDVVGGSGRIPSEQSCGIETLTDLKSLTLHVFDARSDSRLEQMLEPLSGLESLSITGGQRSPLHHLTLIARHSRKLKNLKLDVDTSRKRFEAVKSSTESDFFEHLQKLHVGRVSVPQPTYVAQFLSRILPLGCEIDFERSLTTDVLAQWAEVQKWVPVLIQARLEERGSRTGGNFGLLMTHPRRRKKVKR